MFDETWGYRSWQERGRTEDKVVEKVRSLVRVVSRGGNYLLNIGPAGDGSVVPFEAEVLRGIGRWLAVNGEAIYGTTAGPFDGPEWGDVTARPEAGLLYLHVVDPPDDGVLALPGLESPVVRARPLAGPERDLEVRATAGGPAVVVPGDLERDPAVTVIRVEFSGPLTVRPRNVLRLEVPGAVLLDPARAHSYHSYSGAEYYSTVRTTTRLDWHVEVARTGDYAVDLCYGPAARGRALELALGGQRFQVELSEAEPAASPDVLPSLLPYHARAGPMRLEAGKVHTLSLRLAHPASPHEDLGLAELEVVLRSLGGGG
jgi:alpha-L-fucosidase